jgi:hypothetical protein
MGAKMMRMQLTNAFLANYAEVRGGVLTAVGAYPEWWDLPVIPGAAPIFLVAILDLKETDLGHVFWFDLAVRRPGQSDDESVGFVQALRTKPEKPEEIPEGVPLRNTVVVPANIVFGVAGLHQFALSERGGDQSVRIPVWIRHNPQKQPQLPGF